MATVVVCEGVLRGRPAPLVAALRDDGQDARLVDPFTGTDASAYTFAALGDAVAAAALAAARRHPDRCAALVLLHPVVLYGRRHELADLAAAVRRHGAGAVWERLFGAEAPAPVAGDDVLAAALEGLAADVLLDGPDDLAAVAAPTLLVAAAGDALHAMEVATAYWRLVPTTRMINEVPGDVALWDRPRDLAARIGSFLREIGC